VFFIMTMIAIHFVRRRRKLHLCRGRGRQLLIDAGITGRAGPGTAGRSRPGTFSRVDAVIISAHDHGDHIGNCGCILSRKIRIPTLCLPGGRCGCAARLQSRKAEAMWRKLPGQRQDQIRRCACACHSHPHDGADGSVFVVEAGKKRIGVLTDLGHVVQ